MKTYAEADSYERLFMPTPPDDDPWWCSSQTVDTWKEIYQGAGYSDEKLQHWLDQLISGEFKPIKGCETQLRIGAIRELLGISQVPIDWVCPTCAARERKKHKTSDAQQTSLFA